MVQLTKIPRVYPIHGYTVRSNVTVSTHFDKFSLMCFSFQQVTKAIDSLVKNDFTVPQAKAIIAKLKEQWKEVKMWSAPQLQKLGKLLKDFNVEDLKSLSKEQFQVS